MRAASDIFTGTNLVGLDKDYSVVRRIRKEFPEWRVGNVDIQNPRSVARSPLVRERHNGGLLVLNPPFSQQGFKSVECSLFGETIQTSVAMSYLVRSLEIFRPRDGVIMVAPESMIYSEVDSVARSLLLSRFDLEEVMGLKTTTFRGARVHASVLRIRPSSGCVKECEELISGGCINASLIRGSLPIFRAQADVGGIRLIHTTALAAINTEEFTFRCQRVKKHGASQVSGHVLLLPRVGQPSFCRCRPIRFAKPVQLSDCVFAVVFSCNEDASRAAHLINERWDLLLSQYKGTGARYMTVTRLKAFLLGLGIVVQ